jgi:PTH1 family peptidyl-tRNA hydrolase
MFLFVGLGNPGNEYEKTRHNIGFMAIDEIRCCHKFSNPSIKSKNSFSDGVIASEKILAIKPMSYMNKSGIPMSEIVRFYKIPLSNIIVFHDDLDLPLGKIKIKTGGGHGGHNGLKSIDSYVGKDYVRVRLGIGHPGDRNKVTGYVLNKFKKDEQHIVDNQIKDIANLSELLIQHNYPEFLNKYAMLNQ